MRQSVRHKSQKNGQKLRSPGDEFALFWWSKTKWLTISHDWRRGIRELGRTEEASKNTSRRIASAIQRIFAELKTPLYLESCRKIGE